MYLSKNNVLDFVETEFKKNNLVVDWLNALKFSTFIGEKDLFNQAITRLFCKDKKNLLVYGESGSGKTSFVKELAHRCLINESTFNLIFLSLNVGSIVAQTSYRGELEQKLTQLIFTIKPYKNIILFLDEAQTLAFTQSKEGIGLMDLLKPYLTDSNIKVILATTEDEINFLSSDQAFMRRFGILHLPQLSYNLATKALSSHIQRLQHEHNIELTVTEKNAVVSLLDSYPLHECIDKVDYYLAQKYCNHHQIIY